MKNTKVYNFIITLILAVLTTPFASAGTPESVKKSARATSAFQSLPMTFEPNNGQTRGDVKFTSRGGGFDLSLTNRGGSIIQLKSGDKTAILRMNFVNSKTASAVRGEDSTGGISNYYNTDSQNAVTNVPHFQRVRFTDIYKGVDALFYGDAGTFEYDFIVAPGANPNQIKLDFDGADAISIDKNGDLLIKVNSQTIVQKKPFVYQIVDGAKREINSKYVLRGNRVGFSLGGYNKSKTLVIDPRVTYSTFFGGSSYDAANDIKFDSMNRRYIAGYTFSNNLPVTNGGTRTGDFDVFITRLNAAGTAVEYSTFIGGSRTDLGYAIGVDAAFNAYVTGYTESTNFPTLNAYDASANGGLDAFLVKLDASGARVYSTYLGGMGSDSGNAIVIGADNNPIVVGETASANYPTTVGVAQPATGGGTDAFVTKFDTAGTALAFSTLHGGAGFEDGQRAAIDASGNIYIVGTTTSLNMPISVGAYQMTNGGEQDAFVTKFNPTALTRDYSSYFGGTRREFGEAIAVDSTGNVVITGTTESSPTDAFPLRNAAQTVYGGGIFDAFAARIVPVNNSVTPLVYSTYLGGGGQEQGLGIVTNSSNEAIVIASTFSTNYPTTATALQTARAGSGDVGVTRFGANGAMLYSSYFGGTNEDSGQGDYPLGATLDALGRVCFAGFSGAANLPTTTNALDAVYNGGVDAFVTCYDTSAATTTTAAGVSINGFVTSNQKPLSAVLLTLTDETGVTRTTFSDETGAYSFDNLSTLKFYTVTAKRLSHRFAQDSQEIYLQENATEINFTAIRTRKKR